MSVVELRGTDSGSLSEPVMVEIVTDIRDETEGISEEGGIIEQLTGPVQRPVGR